MASIPVVRFSPPYGPAPRLSPLVEVSVELDGQRMVEVRAAARASGRLMLSPEALAIARFFDGGRDLRAVQRAIHEKYGQILYVERIHELARALHQAGLFEADQTPNRLEAPTVPDLRALVPRFRRLAHAGRAYPANADALRELLRSYFSAAPSPGETVPSPVAGLVAPHVDLFRGGATHARAYQALRATTADIFVILGTTHASLPHLYTATRALYDTPFGPLPTDERALAALAEAYGPELFAHEPAHEAEPSIELSALMLRYLFPDRPITILPVLCGSLYPCAARGERPDEQPEVARMLAGLEIALGGRDAVVIAAADLSHVGELYGDDHAPSAAELAALAEADRQSLSRVEALDPEGFFDHVGPDADTRRIAALTPIYTMLRAVKGTRARLIDYARWVGEETGSAITFAAAAVEA